MVAVIDTGITSQQRTDGWLQSVRGTPGTSTGWTRSRVRATVSSTTGPATGTFAAGVIQQVAPDADLRAYRVLDTDGVASEVEVACALVDAVEAGADIVNLSLGSGTADDLPPVTLSVALEIIAEYEREHERADDRVLLVAAAGNNGDTSPVWPAAFRRVLSVAALTSGLRPASWSSSGFWVDCSTVGEGIVSTYVEGKESPELDLQPDTYGPDPWAFWSGTSFAAPQVAGAVARLRQEGSPSVRHALYDLLGSGRPCRGSAGRSGSCPAPGTESGRPVRPPA